MIIDKDHPRNKELLAAVKRIKPIKGRSKEEHIFYKIYSAWKALRNYGYEEIKKIKEENSEKILYEDHRTSSICAAIKELYWLKTDFDIEFDNCDTMLIATSYRYEQIKEYFEKVFNVAQLYYLNKVNKPTEEELAKIKELNKCIAECQKIGMGFDIDKEGKFFAIPDRLKDTFYSLKKDTIFKE